VEQLEDRRPVSESFGTMLTFWAMAGAERAAQSTPLEVARIDQAFAVTELHGPGANWPNGLSATERVAVVNGTAHDFPTEATVPTALDAFFASLPGDDVDAGPAIRPAHGFSDPLADMPAHVSGDLGLVYTPAHATTLSPVALAMPSVSADLAPSLAAATPPPAVDAALGQAVTTLNAGAAPSTFRLGVASPLPAQHPLTLIGTAHAPPAASGGRPLTGPLTWTTPGSDGIVPEVECGGCSMGSPGTLIGSLPAQAMPRTMEYRPEDHDPHAIQLVGNPMSAAGRTPAVGEAARALNADVAAPLQTDDRDANAQRGDLIRFYGPAYGATNDGASADTGVRYLDGVVAVRATDLASDALGFGWGQTRDWTNQVNQADGLTGNGMVVTDLPHLRQVTGTFGNNYIAISNGFNARTYSDNGAGGYNDQFFIQDTFTANTTNQEFVLTDTMGDQFRFNDFTVTPSAKQGTFKSYTDPYGNVTSVVSTTSAGLPQEVQRSSTIGGTTVVESYLYSYNASNLMTSAVFRRGSSTTGPWTTVRQVVYSYYSATSNYGNAGDLMTASVQDASGTTLGVTYYRYYTSSGPTGYTHGLKYLFRPQAYARLTAALGTNVDSLTDTQVSPYADRYNEYDSSQRVTKVTLAGAGSTQNGGNGQGTFTYAYTKNVNTPNGYNFWQIKTVETLPDGNQRIVYTNHYGEVMLSVYKDVGSGSKWEWFTQLDSNGRAILQAEPSAVTGYDDTKNDLLNNVNGNYQYLSDTTGLIKVLDYLTSAPAGFLQDVKIEQGELGTKITQEAWTYATRSASIGTFYKIANDTVYRDTGGAQPETTSYTYTWVGTTPGIQSVQVTLPTISSTQNGPGVADVETVYMDAWGRPNWFKNADGYISYVAYDQASGAPVKAITDVDTTRTGDFQNLPSGWVSPVLPALHLLSTAAVDALGRTTQYTDPNGNVTYIVYKDTNYEVRVYPGWQSGSSTTTGPTIDYREDRPGSYMETLTMSATPHTTGGVPDGTEAISNLQTLTRTYLNSAGQLAREDAYFNLSGVTWSTTKYIGTQNTNFYTTTLDYDVKGRLARQLTPTNTIYRVVYDGLDRPISTWVGTNDTPPSGAWSPTNNGSPSNMIQISGAIYDGTQGAVSQTGGVGDSNLTQLTLFPGGSAVNRVTNYFYDWRDRLVATKDGVQSTEATTVHRPIVFTTFDNLDEATKVQQFDGDGVTLTFSGGVPVAPSNTLLRAEVDLSYDDQGRVYQTQVGKVDPVNGGAPTVFLNTNLWCNHRGDVAKSQGPGGLATKLAYDGASRVVTQYATDAAGDSSWSDVVAIKSTNNVLSQVETTYDKNDNVIFTVERERFHDETTTGALGNPTTAPKARVYYAADYYDAVDRLTTTVDVGTNGGTAYTRPSTPDARSDTVLRTDVSYNPAGWVDTVTDPRNIQAKDFYDNLGRVTKTVEAYDGGSITSNTNKTTEYSYDGMNHVVTLQSDLPNSAIEQTKWVYGVTTASGSNVNSNDLLSAVQHPDKTTGSASASEQDSQTVDALGETLTATDRNGNVHTLSYDVLGRLTSDTVTTLGSGVDGAVRRIDIAYDTQGNPYLITSYADTGGATIANQVQRKFNGFGQLIEEWQSHSGAVNTSSTPNVQYTYTEGSGGNHSRLTSIVYPNGNVLHYNYASGLDDSISRLTSLSDNSGITVESYSYLGLGTVVKRAHPQPNVDLTYIGTGTGDGGDQYTGLDRFGRVVEQNWYNNTTASSTDDFKYGYDRNGNVLWRTNEINHNFDELYHANGSTNGYDNLNQLQAFARGTLNAGHDTISAPSHSINYTLDAEGNFSSTQTDGGSSVSRTHNKQNEVTGVGAATLTFDANGNLTKDDAGQQYVYDAWNRLVAVKNSGGTTIVSYKVDGLSRRIVENPGTVHDLYYDAAWQVLEERWNGVSTATIQYIWSPVYVDALVLRDRSTLNNGTLDERLYVQQDANYNVTALINTSGSVVERYVYDPYGKQTVLDANFNTRSSSSYAFVIGFQGARLDTTSGLYNERNRDLHPGLGRWIQTDPAGFRGGDTNLYRLTGGAPPGLVDPSGLRAVSPDGYYSSGEAGAVNPPQPQEYTWGELWDDIHTVGVWKSGLIIWWEQSIGAQIDHAIDKYDEYRKIGLSKDDSLGYTIATQVPIINAVTNIAEMIAGTSIDPGDFGQDLTGLGYGTRGANVLITIILLSASARGAQGRGAGFGEAGGATRPCPNTSLPDRVTKALPSGQIRTPKEVAQARNFFKRNQEPAKRWWSERNGGKPWPADATHAEHPRPIADGGDPLFIEPGFDGPNAPHMIPGADGLTDAQRWGRRGGRPRNK
jgi:RHS repeat-associated protein